MLNCYRAVNITYEGPQGLWGTKELAIFGNGNMGALVNISKELGIKVDSGEQFGTSSKETVKNI